MATTLPAKPVRIAEQFRSLASQWRDETAFSSSTSAMVSHPAYHAIIRLGPAVVPLLLHELETEPVHWFEALKAITGEDPVPQEDWGNIRRMADAWLAWGHRTGLI